MRQEVYDEGHLRRYLLGELNEEEQQAVEEGLLTDDESFDLLLAAEDELVDEYVTGALSAEERKGFEGFFLSTSERQRKLSFAMALRRYITAEAGAVTTQAESAEPVLGHLSPVLARRSPVLGHRSSWWKQAFSSPYLRMAAAAVIVLAIGLATWRVSVHRLQVSKGMLALREAYPDQRPTEARITGLNYAPPPPEARGPERDKFDYVPLDRARALIQLEASEHPSAKSYHDLGRLYLAEHDFDKAIDQFEKAVKLDEKDAQLHSDYGAALMEKGRRSGAEGKIGPNIEEFGKSFAELNQALSLDPSLVEALFNRALLREEMGLKEKAAEDWRAYLARDSTGPWADEARRRLANIDDQLRQGDDRNKDSIDDLLRALRAGRTEEAWAIYSARREQLSGELVTALVTEQPGEDYNRGEALDALTRIGYDDERRTGDKYTTELARFYRSASHEQMVAAKNALRLMDQAKEAYGAARVEDATSLREAARQIFSGIGEQGGARLATCWLALHFWELGRTRKSQLLLEDLVKVCEAAHYHWLRARSLHQLATVAFKLGNYSDAFAWEANAGAIAERLNDSTLASNTRAAGIEYYRLLGNRSACFREIAGMRRFLGDSRVASLSQWRQYELLAGALVSFNYPDAAIDFETEALSHGGAGGFVAESYSKAHLGAIYGKAGRYDEALQAVEEAREEAAAHAGESLGDLLAAYADIQMGHLLRELGRFTESRESYDRAIESHRQHRLDFPTHLYQAHKGRLVCCIALRDTVAAREQWEVILKVIDQQRAKIREEENRDCFLDVEQNTYDLGIDFAYSLMNDPDKSFEYAEASRARSLLDSITASPEVVTRNGNTDLALQAKARPMRIDQIQLRLTPDARLLEYAVLDDKLLVWVVSSGGRQSVAVPIPQDELSQEVNGFLSNLQQGSKADSEQTNRLAHELHFHLIIPVETLLAGCSKLVVVPDKFLNRLPWDALLSPATNRFLIQDYEVTLAPSATMFADRTDLAARKDDGRVERAVSVGDPSFDRRAFPQLERLGAAAREAESVARLYECRPLIGAAAGKVAVSRELARVDVAHFAMHCVIDEHSPMQSSLVLAKPTGKGADDEDGRLQAAEIYRLRLPRLRLVVLSACRTGVERYYRAEGMIGLARAFLVARVPLVVASLWPVNSEATEKLMVRFHEYRKRDQLPTSAALCRAKRRLIEEPEGAYGLPYYWAAFQLIGGQASF